MFKADQWAQTVKLKEENFESCFYFYLTLRCENASDSDNISLTHQK